LPNFVIIPPRLIVGSSVGTDVVTSVNGVRGDLIFSATDGLQLGLSGKTFTLSVIPNTYVLKSGDTFTGNLQFVPTGGAYGLRLHTSTTDPSQSAEGAAYVNTSDGTLKIYLGGSWLDVGQMGSLTEAQADLRYLKLDGSNDPITGDISMGVATLRFGNKAGDPVSGSAGDVYFNTSLNKLRLHNGSAWVDVGSSGVTSISSGNGLAASPSSPITSTGTLSVDQAYNFNWTGAHTFSQAISFASGQTFDASKLTIGSQATGDILYYSGSAWSRLAIGSSGEVLTVVSGAPQWEPALGGQIGTPSDGVYSDGFFDSWTSSTDVSNAFDDVNELLKDIAPVKAGLLTGNALTQISMPTFYSVKLSSGLTADWYPSGVAAGDTINTYYLSGNIELTSPSASSAFRAGRKLQPLTFGSVNHRIHNNTNPSGATAATIDLTTEPSIPATSGSLTVTDHGIYNSIWMKANAEVNYTQTAEGWEGHSISSTEAGETLRLDVWRDTHSNSNPTPSFSTSPTATEDTPVNKYLSGINHYGLNSTFEVRFAAASGIFNRCYNSTQVARISGTGMPNLNLNPGSTPNYLDAYDRTGVNFALATLSTSNSASPNKYLTVTIYKAHGASASSNASINRPICTYGTVSTNTSDVFMDEAQRLVIGTTTSWTSSSALSNGNAQQKITGTNVSSLQYPDSSDYPGFTGDQEYQRFIYKTSASTGTITFGTLTAAQISPYGTGDVNILLYLDDDAVWFDLGVVQGSNSNDGSSRALAIPVRVSTTTSGSTVGFSFGTYTTGPTGSGNLGRYRIVIIFRNNTRTITSLTGA
jgi:hypothetical protein